MYKLTNIKLAHTVLTITSCSKNFTMFAPFLRAPSAACKKKAPQQRCFFIIGKMEKFIGRCIYGSGGLLLLRRLVIAL